MLSILAVVLVYGIYTCLAPSHVVCGIGFEMFDLVLSNVRMAFCGRKFIVKAGFHQGHPGIVVHHATYVCCRSKWKTLQDDKVMRNKIQTETTSRPDSKATNGLVKATPVAQCSALAHLPSV